jgi:SPP1 family phage portal protein
MAYRVIADNAEINAKNLTDWLADFNNNILPDRINFGEYYDGKNQIVKQGAVQGRPNYSINVNMAKYIIDVATSYAFGVPVVYDTKNENQKDIVERLKDILKNCDANAVDFQQGGDMSTFGVSYQLIMALDGTAPIEDRILFKHLNPLQTFYVIDNTILENPICAVYFYNYKENNVQKTKIYVYDNEILRIYVGSYNEVQSLESEEYHNMGAIPIIECLNNDDAFSDIQCVLDLLDALSLSVSNNTDDLQSIANAILAASGGTLSEENIELINKTKTANLPMGASMEWIVKNLNPEATKQHLDYLLAFLYQISQVPDLSDEAFGGNQSGVAMQYKLWGLNQLWATKTTKYEKALYQRLKIVLHLLQYQFSSNVELLKDITITFSKNLPQNNSEVYQMAQALKDIISKRSMLAQIPFIEDVDAEIEELDKEAEKNADIYGFNNNANLGNSKNEE